MALSQPEEYRPFDVLDELALQKRSPVAEMEDVQIKRGLGQGISKGGSTIDPNSLQLLKQLPNNLGTYTGEYNGGAGGGGGVTSNPQRAWTTSPQTWATVSPSYYDDTPSVSTSLDDAITKCGNSFYFLVSPHAQTDGDGMWHAKGRRALGKGTTPLEAVNDLLTKLTPDDESE